MHRSARPGALSKTQRQNFAKFRQVALDRSSGHLSSFPGLTRFPSARDGKSPAGIEVQDVATEGRSQSVKKPPVTNYCTAIMPVCLGFFPYSY